MLASGLVGILADSPQSFKQRDGGVPVVQERIRIEGNRVVLRDAVRRDLDVLAYWLEPDNRWQELDGPATDLPGPADRDRILAERRAIVEADSLPVPRTVLSIATLDTDEMIGQVMLDTGTGPAVGEPRVSIVIFNPDFWGYGLGYEALGLWIDDLFATLPDQPRIDLETWNQNAGMVRLAGKLGFDEVSAERRGLFRRRPDSRRFTLDRDAWNRHYPDGFRESIRAR